MRTYTSFLRATGFSVLGFLILLWLGDTGDRWAFAEQPILWLVLVVFILFVVAGEMIIAAIQRMLYESLTAAQKESYKRSEAERKEKQFVWLKKKYAALLDSKPVLKEDEILLDHNYDGIRELDNNLPPWWKYLFYVSIIFAGWYLTYYHFLGGTKQYEEYEQEVAAAKIAIAKYKAENKDLIDAESVVLLTEASDISAGKSLFGDYCVACHAADGGGGIGPNLTDEYWILGGGIKNIFYTISEGGRSGKGMVPWKDVLKPDEIAQVASYIISLQGTSPADPKEPQGDHWEGGDEFIH